MIEDILKEFDFKYRNANYQGGGCISVPYEDIKQFIRDKLKEKKPDYEWEGKVLQVVKEGVGKVNMEFYQEESNINCYLSDVLLNIKKIVNQSKGKTLSIQIREVKEDE